MQSLFLPRLALECPLLGPPPPPPPLGSPLHCLHTLHTPIGKVITSISCRCMGATEAPESSMAVSNHACQCCQTVSSCFCGLLHRHCCFDISCDDGFITSCVQLSMAASATIMVLAKVKNKSITTSCGALVSTAGQQDTQHNHPDHAPHLP